MIMSEIKKNIETCRGEDVLAEVSALPQDPHFGSLVNEAFDPMQQQALHQAGYDGYSEVIEQHKPYTFASAIIQMKSNLLLLLRALWQFPFGSGTRSLSDDASLRSLADMWSHYITRLSGNETYGIPSRLSSLTDLPSAPLLLADRKISGVPDAVDGMSMVHQLGNSAAANAITEIDDDNHGWVLDKAIGNIAPNCERATIRCGSITAANALNSFHAQKLYMPELETITSGTSQYNDPMPANPEEIYIDELVESDCIFCQKDVRAKKISARKLRKLNGRCFYDWSVANEPLAELRLPELRNIPEGFLVCWTGDTSRKPWTNLILFEIGSDVSLNISAWNPTNALDASLDTLVTDEDCHNNLEQFLYNFRTYIALRLATFASNGPTLTLSQAVYDAIKDESHLFVFDEGTMTIYAYLTNIKHWTVTK